MPEPSDIKGNKSGRRISKDTETYRLFEKLFIELEEEALPYSLDMSKGQAINLAMGLNRCHIQWARDSGIPSEYISRSAKAIQPLEGSTQWKLEISLNQRHSRAAKKSWISNLLTNAPAAKAIPSLPEAEEPDACEELLRNLYGEQS